MNKPNYYAILSAEVRYDKNLRPNVKLLYAEITALCNMNGICYASNKYFAELYGKSKGAISGWISELVKHGYIQIDYTYKEGSKEIEHRYIKIMKGGVTEKDNPLYQKTLKSNTTNTNNNLTDSNIKRFKKPHVFDVATYCNKRNNNIDPEAFYDFYESKDWMIGKSKMKDWKAAVRTWEKNEKKNKTMSKLDSQINAWQEAKKLL